MNATAEIPTPVSSPTARAEELVRSMSPEVKEAAFILMLKELIEINNGGRCLIPISTETEQLGYYVPPLAADERFEAYGPKLSPEREAEIAERFTRLHESIPIEQAIEELRQQELALRAQQSQLQAV